MSKYGHIPHDWFEALLNKMGGEERGNAFLRGELTLQETHSGVLVVTRSSPFNAATSIGSGWSTWLGPKTGNGLSGEPQRDKRSLALTEIDLDKIRFKTYLSEDETGITGEEKLKILKATGDIGLDAQVGWDLFKESGQKSLRWLYRQKKVTWMEFPGEVLRSPVGNRCFLCLYCYDNRSWRWDHHWLDDNHGVGNLAAVLSLPA